MLLSRLFTRKFVESLYLYIPSTKFVQVELNPPQRLAVVVRGLFFVFFENPPRRPQQNHQLLALLVDASSSFVSLSPRT